MQAVKQTLLAIGTLAIALVMTGCIEATTVIKLNDDGSGTITIKYLGNTKALEQAAVVNSGFQAFDRNRLVAAESKLGRDVALVRAKQITEGAREGFIAEYGFVDISQIRIDGLQEVFGMIGTYGKLRPAYRFEYTPGQPNRITVIPTLKSTPTGLTPSTPPGDPLTDPDANGQFLRFFDGGYVSIYLQANGTITSSNATFPMTNTPNAITLLYLNTGKMLQSPPTNPNSLIGASSIDDMSRIITQGVNGVRVEDPLKQVVIEFQ